MGIIGNILVVLIVILVTSGEASNVVCLFKPIPGPVPVENLHGTGRIIFIPTDDFPISKLEDLSHFYHSTYGLNIDIASPLSLPSTAYNQKRKQFIAQEILAEAKMPFCQLLFSITFDPNRVYHKGHVH